MFKSPFALHTIKRPTKVPSAHSRRSTRERARVSTPSDSPQLPPELVGRVLELAISPYDVPPILDVDYSSFRETVQGERARQRLLLSASLVSRAWSGEARRILWTRVYLSRGSAVRRVTKTMGKRREAPTAIFLHAKDREVDEVKTADVEQLLEDVDGLRTLVIAGVEGLTIGSFVRPGLAGESGA